MPTDNNQVIKAPEYDETPMPDYRKTSVGDPVKNMDAKEWSINSGIAIFYLPITPEAPNKFFDKNDLDKLYAEYEGECIDHRKISDTKSLEIFGYTNRERYNMVVGYLVQNKYREPRPTTQHVATDRPLYEYTDPGLAWSKDTNIHMILPEDKISIEALELSHNKYLATDYNNRKRADAKSIELYGKSCEDRYREYRKELLDKESDKELHDSDKNDYLDLSSNTPIFHEETMTAYHSLKNDKMFKKIEKFSIEMHKEIKYGYPDKNGYNMRLSDPASFDDEVYFATIYKLLSAKEVKKYKCGVCYDQVEYEREYFTKLGLDFKSYFIGYRRGNRIAFNMPSHTFILINFNGKIIWFENAWGTHAGMMIFHTIEEAIDKIADFFMDKDTSHIRDLFCKEYKQPKYGCSMREFLDNVMVIDDAPVQEAMNLATGEVHKQMTPLQKAANLYKLTQFIDTDFSEKARIKHMLNELQEEESGKEYKTTLPFFTPEEMFELGVFCSENNCYATVADNSYLGGDSPKPLIVDDSITPMNPDEGITSVQWFDNYIAMCKGCFHEDYSKQWINTLRMLYRDFGKIKESGDIDKINARKQSILNLGWNPEIEFTQENMVKADHRVNALLEFKGKYSHVDLTITPNDDLENMIDDEIQARREIAPVYIILDKGRKIYSGAIAAFSGSEYTHTSIGFKDDMSENYTYLADGFSRETLSSYADDDISVYAFFVSNEVLENMKKKVTEFKDNASKSYYDFRKFVDFIIDRTRETTSQYAQVCSTFVDNVLKAVGIHIASPSRGIVTPGDIDKGVKNNKNTIYKVYDGNAKQYKSSIVKGKVSRLIRSKNTKVLKESYDGIDEKSILLEFINDQNNRSLQLIKENYSTLSEDSKQIYDKLIKPYTEVVVFETKLFPVQFDKEGNLLIYQTKTKTADFAQHFEESNKLIQTYHKANNIEGIKFELAKLWYMNITIEKMLKKNQNKDWDRQHYVDCRARILNVFYKYMDYVMSIEKSWNFAEYYNGTPFSDASIKINNTTIKYTLATIKNLLKI